MIKQLHPLSIHRWRLPHIVIATYTVFLAGFYFVPNAVDLYKFYIAVVFLPGLLLLPTTLRRTLHSPIWLSVLAYLAYMLISSFWSETFSIEVLWRDVRYVAYVLSFILLTVFLFERNRRLPPAIMLIVTLVAIVAAVASVVTFRDFRLLLDLTDDYRLVGVGTIGNPNPSAFIYGFWGVFALDYARRHYNTVLGWFCACGVLIMFLFIILSQSNAGLLALATACSLLFITDRYSGRISSRAVVIGLLLMLGSAVFLAWSLGLLNKPIDAGFANRLPIWQHVLHLWQQAPILGQGYQLTPLLDPDGKVSIFNYAHSVFLSTLRDGGIVGLALLLLVYFFALRSAARMVFRERRGLYLCLFVFGLVCMLADTDQVVTRPREQWVIFWLPLACLVAYELGLVSEARTSSLTTHAKRTGTTRSNAHAARPPQASPPIA